MYGLLVSNMWYTMRSSVCPSATKAFFLPRRLTQLQYLAESLVFRVIEAAQAHSHNTAFKWAFPDRARVLFFYRCSGGCWINACPRGKMVIILKMVMSVPISAILTEAACSLMPGIVTRRSIASCLLTNRSRTSCWDVWMRFFSEVASYTNIMR